MLILVGYRDMVVGCTMLSKLEAYLYVVTHHLDGQSPIWMSRNITGHVVDG